MRVLSAFLTGAGILAFAGGANAQTIDWEKVDAAFGRKVKGVKVYAEDAADYVELLLTRYLHRRGAANPSFGAFVNSLDDEGLARFARPEAER